ncbi:hypothetical protein KW800_01720 [Candidatus Parcubacteria bacterium]|nr:hypothetical protein [Candidatus Parcubacteria bacterium]
MSTGMLGRVSLSDLQGPMNDLMEKLAGPNGHRWLRELNRFLRRQGTWTSLLPLVVESDGNSGEDYIRYLARNWELNNHAKQAILSPEFVVTRDVKYEIQLLMRSDFDVLPTSKSVYQVAAGRGYKPAPLEVGPLLRSMMRRNDFKKLGIQCIVVMQPEEILTARFYIGMDDTLSVVAPGAEKRWSNDTAWAFVAPEEDVYVHA